MRPEIHNDGYLTSKFGFSIINIESRKNYDEDTNPVELVGEITKKNKTESGRANDFQILERRNLCCP